MTEPPVEPKPGFLHVGRDEHDQWVIIDHPQLLVDDRGCGHIVFSPREALEFAALLIKHAKLCKRKRSNA